MAGTKSAQLTCLCGAISLPGSYLEDKQFPIDSRVCHCDACRYTSGGLVPTFAGLTGPPPEDVLAKVTAYQFTKYCVRYFCTTCGSHVFVSHPDIQDWFCPAGIIDPPSGVKDVISLSIQTYIPDTEDAGVTSLFLPLTTTGGRALYCEEYNSEKLSTNDVNVMMLSSAREMEQPGAGEQLTARCHCGGVDLKIKRASYEREPEGVKTLMRADDPGRYLARFCACRSCRLSMGFSLCPWTYVALGSVLDTTTLRPVRFGREALSKDANEGLLLKLTHYESSDGVWRTFCSGCGASVFYYTEAEERRNVVDVAVGLLRAQSGSLAREWVRWADGEVSHGDEGTDQSLVGCIKKHGQIV